MSGKHILIVEDNGALREMIRRRLQRFGFATSQAEDGERGLSMAFTNPPDAILLDMSLPGKNGWTVVGELKNDARTQAVPVIAITAHAMRGDREKALRAGCDEYVSKPINFRTLTQKLAVLLNP